MISRIVLARYLGALLLAGAGVFGCSSDPLGIGTGKRFAQDAEVDFAPPLKMKVTSCSWTTLADPAEGMRGPRAPVRPDTSASANKRFLIVEVVVTNYGSRPLTSTGHPIFRLKSAAGATYQPDPSFISGMSRIAMMGTNVAPNINPGSAEPAKLVFDAPDGKYELEVHRGQWNGGGFNVGPIIWVWELSPSTATPKDAHAHL